MLDFSLNKIPSRNLPCSFCGAKHPQWAFHASYDRYLISYEKGAPTTYTIQITRIVCSSCGHTHAILPEILIPYTSYSLIFVLNVLRDYFLSNISVLELCNKYQISQSTLYSWKHLFLTHKKLWLGVLEDAYMDSYTFLSFIPTINTSSDLHKFFSSNGQSFLQGSSKTARFNSS
ncbi:DUF6431 domain-containing protein [Clostridium sp. 19966]|uniref:DUF6431 domain-containing protein n=1 Tax=Clostridium sp. 19966 TaxID=2768166 RepID=UPI0028EDF465|nr:DUF6431 domain-containing protein [Clostridium sp. 19966]